MKHPKLYERFKQRVAPSPVFQALLQMAHELFGEKGLVLCFCDGKEFTNASGTIETIQEKLMQTLPSGNEKSSLMDKLNNIPNSAPWIASVPVVFVTKRGWSFLRIGVQLETVGRN